MRPKKSTPPKSIKTDLADSLLNIVSGLGTRSDKATATEFSKRFLPLEELNQMYASDWISKKVCKIPADDMTKKWRSFLSEKQSPDQIKQIERAELRLGLKQKVSEAILWARVYGGCGMIPIVKGQKDYSKPVQMSRIRKNSVARFVVVSPRSLKPSGTQVSSDPFSPNYLLPKQYTLTGGADNNAIHHSWVIRFDGEPIDEVDRQQNQFWGYSALQAMYDAIQHSGTASQSIASLLHELNINVVSVEGLDEKLAAGQEGQIKQRFEVYSVLKSVWNMIVTDSKEQYSNRSINTSNMHNIINVFLEIVAAAADIPVTRLLGQSPAGLNSTGESDLRNYYDMVNAWQECRLRPSLDRIDEFLFRSEFGNEVPKDLSYEFNPLFVMSEKDQADVDKKNADRDKVYIDARVITPYIAAQQLKQDGVYDNITEEHLAEVKKIELEQPESDAAVDTSADDDDPALQ